MADLDLSAVCSFLNDLSLEEIITYESDDGADTSSLASDGSDDSRSTAPVAEATSDENSDWEDAGPGAKSQTQRDRQRVYGIRSRDRKKAQRIADYQVFLTMVDKFIELVQWRLAMTEKEIQLLCLAKKNGDPAPAGDTARTQLELNQGPMSCIQTCLTNWDQHKKTSKFFFRAETKDIESLMQRLTDSSERLTLVNAELKWRLQAQTTGVWV